MNRAFAAPAPRLAETNAAPAMPVLTDTQRKASSDYLALADAITAALAAFGCSKEPPAKAEVSAAECVTNVVIPGGRA